MTDVNSEPMIEKDMNQGVKVDSSIVAKPFRDEIRRKVQLLKSHGIGVSSTVRMILFDIMRLTQ